MKSSVAFKLEEKLQPQWNFKTKEKALRELQFQKDYNPSTYRWLRTKNIIVNNQVVSVKNLIKEKNIQHRPSSKDPLGMREELRRAGF
jgi:hypothetical protein